MEMKKKIWKVSLKPNCGGLLYFFFLFFLISYKSLTNWQAGEVVNLVPWCIKITCNVLIT